MERGYCWWEGAAGSEQSPVWIPFLGAVPVTKVSLNHQSNREQHKFCSHTGVIFCLRSHGISDEQWVQLLVTASKT